MQTHITFYVVYFWYLQFREMHVVEVWHQTKVHHIEWCNVSFSPDTHWYNVHSSWLYCHSQQCATGTSFLLSNKIMRKNSLSESRYIFFKTTSFKHLLGACMIMCLFVLKWCFNCTSLCNHYYSQLCSSIRTAGTVPLATVNEVLIRLFIK